MNNRSMNLEDAVRVRNHVRRLAEEYSSLDEAITKQLNRIIASSDPPKAMQVCVPNATPSQSDIIDLYTTKVEAR